MHAVTIMLVSAAMAGGGDWPDDTNSRAIAQQNRTTATSRNGQPGAPPSPLRYSEQGSSQATYDNQFGTGSAPRTSGRKRGSNRQTAAQTQFTLPDLTSSVPSANNAAYGDGTTKRQASVSAAYQQPTTTASGNPYNSEDFMSPAGSYRAALPDDTESDTNAQYIPPAQSAGANLAGPGAVDSGRQPTAGNSYYSPPGESKSSNGFEIDSTRQPNQVRNDYRADRGIHQDNTGNEYRPLNPNFQQAPPLPAQQQLPQLSRNPLYSAQNTSQAPMANPLESIHETVDTAANAAKQTLGNGARRINGALEAGAQNVARESQRQGNSNFLTLLALFGSIGLNLYLGWIAWDTYNRYQDLVADMRFTGSRRANEFDDRYENKSALAETGAY